MRRLVSVFSKKDKDKRESDGKAVRARPLTLTLGLPTPPIPVLVQSQESSISSSSIRTPDFDDDLSHVDAPVSVGKLEDSSRLSPSSSNFWKRLTRRTSSVLPPRPPEIDSSSHETHDAEDEYGDPEPAQKSTCPPPDTLSGKDTFIHLTKVKLVPYPSYPPLLHPPTPNFPPFPSSCAPHQSCVSRPTLAMSMFRSRLLRQLDGVVSHVEEDILSQFPLTGGSLEPRTQYPDLSNPILEPYLPTGTHVSFQSPGLQRWIERPCFEDRYTTYIAQPDLSETKEGIVTSCFAVATLEYSEHLDNLVAPDGSSQLGTTLSDPSVNSMPPSPSLSSRPSSALPSHLPSSLRQEQQPTPNNPAMGSHQSSPTRDSSTSESAAPARRGVRFAQEDEREDIPLGYAVRRQQQKAAKAKLLQAQKERRGFEAKQARILQEQHRIEQERLVLEKERRAREQERRINEEENRQRQYAASFAAARQRQESSRSGGTNSPRHSISSGSYSSLRDGDVQRSQRQQSSSPASPSSSRNNSRPGSISLPPPVANSHARSQPSSLYSSSSDDSRTRDSSGRLNSSSAHSRPASERSLSYKQARYPTLSQQTSGVPVPNINYLEMPLMPPTPPFVLQQYANRRHSQSPGRSYPRSPSTGGIDRQPHSAPGRDGSSSPQGHHRVSSGDSRHTSSLGPHTDRGRVEAAPRSRHVSSIQPQESSFHPRTSRRHTAIS